MFQILKNEKMDKNKMKRITQSTPSITTKEAHIHAHSEKTFCQGIP